MNLIDFSDDLVDFKVDLYESVTDRPKVLAKCVGPFFVPDGVSRNKRFYPEAFWRSVISTPDVTRTLQNGMLGTLLHPTNEKLSHPMYSSHTVKRLWIDDKSGTKMGLGEAYILDTPIGRIIDTFQSSGMVNLFVSSRAWGKYIEGKKHEGMPVVDQKNYVLKTFDFVLEPGFLEARPSFSKTMEMLEECYYDTLKDIPDTCRKESQAEMLVRDLDLILGRKK